MDLPISAAARVMARRVTAYLQPLFLDANSIARNPWPFRAMAELVGSSSLIHGYTSLRRSTASRSASPSFVNGFQIPSHDPLAVGWPPGVQSNMKIPAAFAANSSSSRSVMASPSLLPVERSQAANVFGLLVVMDGLLLHAFLRGKCRVQPVAGWLP